MASQSEIKAAIERATSIFSMRPHHAEQKKSVVCTVREGLRCEGTDGSFSFAADTVHPLGGENTAPAPGAHALFALGSCLAIGYAMIFAKRALPLHEVKVEVEFDVDMRGAVGVGGSPRAFKQLRYTVDVDSPADPAAIREALDEADANSPVLASFADPVPVARTLRLGGARDAAE